MTSVLYQIDLSVHNMMRCCIQDNGSGCQYGGADPHYLVRIGDKVKINFKRIGSHDQSELVPEENRDRKWKNCYESFDDKIGDDRTEYTMAGEKLAKRNWGVYQDNASDRTEAAIQNERCKHSGKGKITVTSSDSKFF